MSQAKELHIVIKRINNNKYILCGKILDYIQLINWFKDFITD